jgi:hypothetical protein
MSKGGGVTYQRGEKSSCVAEMAGKQLNSTGKALSKHILKLIKS